MTDLEKALIVISKTLSENRIPYMVIGGMANAVWGNPRVTFDIDVTLWVTDKEIQNVVQILSEAFEVLVSRPIDFILEMRVLPLQTKNGVRLDIIFGSLPYEQEAIQRSIDVDISGTPVRFCTPEDLILHKIISTREKDLDDIIGLLNRRLSLLDLKYLEPRIRELVKITENPDTWKRWLEWKKEASKHV
ncbi:MAG TPA: hypothetical protein ENI07_02725 [Desulfobacterales bacterium]|nr:hypothetical protein [Desulfobacterales bacterium]